VSLESGKPLHARRLPFLRNVINRRIQAARLPYMDEAMALSDLVPIEEVYRRAAAINKNDVCNMQYTSGTTGFPKGLC
jgi:fatty-acyl-CoA synthase